jgi:hypothetical protein
LADDFEAISQLPSEQEAVVSALFIPFNLEG